MQPDAPRGDALNLDRFRQVQTLAYDAVKAVEESLEPGITEREAAARVRAWLERRGIRHFFHRPFAWFGDRARFANFRTPFDFFPTTRRLEWGMSVILDVAPIQEGFTADVGYAFAFGDAPEVDRALDALEDFRDYILEAVLAERSLLNLYREVDAMMKDLGYENCHQRYPFGVLGHRVKHTRFPVVSRPSMVGFGMGAGLRLLGEAARAKVLGPDVKWPFWSDHLSAETRASPGLWAIEPHMGRGQVGVKWEELLVVTPSTAYWLDDEVPHVQRWRSRKESRSAHGA